MKHQIKIIKLTLYFSILLLLFPKPAFAYLDPGAGSYLLQIIAASFFTALFLFKGWWKKAKEFFLKIILRKDKHLIEKTSNNHK